MFIVTYLRAGVVSSRAALYVWCLLMTSFQDDTSLYAKHVVTVKPLYIPAHALLEPTAALEAVLVDPLWTASDRERSNCSVLHVYMYRGRDVVNGLSFTEETSSVARG